MTCNIVWRLMRMGRKDLAASQGEISAAAFLYGCAPTRLRRPTFYGHDQFSCALTKRRPSSSSDFIISRTIFAIFVRPSTVSAKSGSKSAADCEECSALMHFEVLSRNGRWMDEHLDDEIVDAPVTSLLCCAKHRPNLAELEAAARLRLGAATRRYP